MTSPAQTTQSPPQQQQQQQDRDQALALAALAVLLTSGLTVAAMGAYAATILAPLGVSLLAAKAALRLATAEAAPAPFGAHLTVTARGGTVVPFRRSSPAVTHTRATEGAIRAAYLLGAARRIEADLRSGKTVGEAVSAERPYLIAHLRAGRNRVASARTVDQAAAAHGPLLGWKAVLDRRTDRQCRAANGRNFLANTPPLIGWPGTVHPFCRCMPVAPYRGAQVLPTAYRAAAA